MTPAPTIPLREAVMQLGLVVAGGLVVLLVGLCWLTPAGCSLLTGAP